MARKRKADPGSAPLHRTLTPPGLFLVRMLVFLTLVVFLARHIGLHALNGAALPAEFGRDPL